MHLFRVGSNIPAEKAEPYPVLPAKLFYISFIAEAVLSAQFEGVNAALSILQPR